MVRRRNVLVLVVVVLILASSYEFATNSVKSSSSRFVASFSDFESFKLLSNDSYESQVSLHDVSVVPPPSVLGQQTFPLVLTPTNQRSQVNVTVLNVITNHVYSSVLGSNLSMSFNFGVFELRSSQASNLTVPTTIAALNGPLRGPTLGVGDLSGRDLTLSMPKSFDVSLDIARNSTNGPPLNESLIVRESGRIVAGGWGTSGITLRVAGATSYQATIPSDSAFNLYLTNFESYLYRPYSYPASGTRILYVVSPVGRMNVSSGQATFLGVENVSARAQFLDFQVLNNSGRLRMTFTGTGGTVLVNGAVINSIPLAEQIEGSLPLIFSGSALLIAVLGFVLRYLDFRERRKEKELPVALEKFQEPLTIPFNALWAIRVRGNKELERCRVTFDGTPLMYVKTPTDARIEMPLPRGGGLNFRIPASSPISASSRVVILDGDNPVRTVYWDEVIETSP